MFIICIYYIHSKPKEILQTSKLIKNLYSYISLMIIKKRIRIKNYLYQILIEAEKCSL